MKFSKTILSAAIAIVAFCGFAETASADFVRPLKPDPLSCHAVPSDAAPDFQNYVSLWVTYTLNRADRVGSTVTVEIQGRNLQTSFGQPPLLLNSEGTLGIQLIGTGVDLTLGSDELPLLASGNYSRGYTLTGTAVFTNFFGLNGAYDLRCNGTFAP